MIKFFLKKDFLLLCGSALFRSSAVSLSGVIIAIYWSVAGFNSLQIGILITLGLLGGTAATWVIAKSGDRWGRKRCLIILNLLTLLGGVALALSFSFTWLCLFIFFGMANGMGRDRFATSSLEQSIISAVPDVKSRTKVFSIYNLIMEMGHASGNLLAFFPLFLRRKFESSELHSYQETFILYTFMMLICGVLYLFLSKKIEVNPISTQTLSEASKKRVRKFSMMSFIDASGGGFLTNALVSYWFYKTFGIGEEMIGILFFVARIANACSFIGAAWLAHKVGLLNTMVFTHIPASILLMFLPLMPTFHLAAILYLIRECLVEMDVPTRQAYITSIVAPHERTFAIGILTVWRNLGWAVSPAMAGGMMKSFFFSSPFLIGPGIKIIYDLLIYSSFRKIHPQD